MLFSDTLLAILWILCTLLLVGVGGLSDEEDGEDFGTGVGVVSACCGGLVDDDVADADDAADGECCCCDIAAAAAAAAIA